MTERGFLKFKSVSHWTTMRASVSQRPQITADSSVTSPLMIPKGCLAMVSQLACANLG